MANTGKKLNDGLQPGEGYFGYVAGVLGHTVEARSVVGELEARREKGYSPALGETTAALEWLETALTEHDPFLGSAMVFPGYDAASNQDSGGWRTNSNSYFSGDFRPGTVCAAIPVTDIPNQRLLPACTAISPVKSASPQEI